MQILQLPSPAKLNLFLHITGQREDGYHNLQTLFQLLDYGDTVTLTRRNNAQIRFIENSAAQQTAFDSINPEDNLAVRAAQALRKATGFSGGVDINIEKRIPMGAGLGGGSSNAATVLVGLNKMWRLDLNINQLADIGLALGADVPVFIRGVSCFAEGVGEQIQAVEIPQKSYLVVKPSVNIPTSAIFSHPQLTRDSRTIRIAAFFEQGEIQQSVSVKSSRRIALQTLEKTRNDCQAVVSKVYPQVADLIEELCQYGQARLSGTGSCVFLPTDSEEQALKVANKLKESKNVDIKNYDYFICKGVNQSPLFSYLADT